MLSSIGLPLFAVAPFRIQIIRNLSAQPLLINLLLFGMLGYGIGVLRILYEIVNNEIEAFRAIKLRHFFRIESIILSLGLVCSFLIAIFPQIFENPTLLLIQIYDKLIA
jgi:hypothetical protein